MKHKKWLLRKVSGSKAKYTYKPDYSEERNKKSKKGDILPYREHFKKKGKTYLDTSLVKRWLYAQVGLNFNEVYSAFLERIQPKYLDEYRDCIYYYVDKPNEVKWDKNGNVISTQNRFFIHPDDNILYKYDEYEVAQQYKNSIIDSDFGSFYFDRDTKVWKLQLSQIQPLRLVRSVRTHKNNKIDRLANYCYELIISANEDELNEKFIDKISIYIEKMDKLFEKILKAIDEDARKLADKQMNQEQVNFYNVHFVNHKKPEYFEMNFNIGKSKKAMGKAIFDHFSLVSLHY